MGWFVRALSHLLEAYRNGDLFRLITYDAGACSVNNADFVCEHGVHYLFAVGVVSMARLPLNVEEGPIQFMTSRTLRRLSPLA